MPVPGDIQAKLKSGRFSDADVQTILDWQIALPSEEKECDLMRECVLYLQPDAGKITDVQKQQLWHRIDQRIDKPHISKRRVAAFVLAAVFILALAMGALAWASKRGIFNFIFDFGLKISEYPAQECADALVQSDLAHISLPHVDVEVREAAYDGNDLMVVYAIIERGRDTYVTDDEVYQGTLEAAMQDGIYVCDWIEINGQTAYFDRTYAARGENPGELLCYLQANVSGNHFYSAGGEIIVGDQITVGLPLLPLSRVERGASQVPEGLLFTLDATRASMVVRRAKSDSVMIDGVTVAVEVADFSPISGILRLVFTGEEARARSLSDDFAGAQLFDLEGNAVGVTQRVYYGTKDEDGYRTQLVAYPPEVWPRVMLLGFTGEDGTINEDVVIIITLE